MIRLVTPMILVKNFFSSEFQDKGVNIIAVGIGEGIKKEELENIAGERGSVVQVADFSLLASKLSEILADVCSKCLLLYLV